jgi:hypothetical protein
MGSGVGEVIVVSKMEGAGEGVGVKETVVE